jgi:maleylacetoacetate isomerase/maleylpyruvate isomerase
VITVHRIPHSTNVERVALAAGHKSVPVEWVDHDAADRSAIVALSGQELVPVAEIDGAVVRGSMRIVERLEALHPDPPLVSPDPAAAASARIFVSWFDRVWKGPPNALDADPEPPDADALRARAREWTGWCVALLNATPYLGGEALGLADICAFPFLKYAVVDPEPDDEDRFHRVLVELLRADAHPALDEWVRRIDELPRA